MEKYADELDLAQAHESEMIDRKISQIRSIQPVAIPTGHCLYCDEPMDTERRWCDATCRDLWEADKRGR